MNQSTQFWKQWIALQLKHNLKQLCDISIKNFHFPGLNYICFEFSPTQTIRLYIVDPKDNLATTDVNIHNHLYDSQILVLHGSILNTIYKLDNERDDYNIYSLTSALCPTNSERKIKLEFLTKRGLTIHRSLELGPGDTHFQPHTEIHNVENDPTKLTSFMVFEFATVKKNSRIFTKKEWTNTIPTPGCYIRYEPNELKSLVESVLDVL
jgi:hypothetical protein